MHATLTGQRQNDEMRTLTEASLDHMPELHWAWGYPFALLLMFVFGYVLYRLFKRRRRL